MNRLIGVGLVGVSSAAFGTLAIFGRFAYDDGLDVFTIMFFRFTLAAVLMGGVLAVRREPLPPRTAVLRLVGMGAVGYVGQAFSYLTALHYASAGLVALLLYLYPVFVAGLSAVFLHERLNGRQLAALGVALVGVVLTVGPEGGQLLGVVLAVLAAVIYSVYILVGTQVMRQVSAMQSSTIIFASAGVMSGLLMLLKGPQLPQTSTGWLMIGGIVVVATIVPVATFLAGLKRVGPTTAATLSTLEPVVTVLLAALLLHEFPQPVTLVGGVLILAAVLVLTHGELQRNK